MTDISIIVPAYNAEKYIKKCLDSLVNQTKKELEFIVINDGSKDNTEKIIKEYKDKRIKYFKNKNQGIGKTRNFGIKKASGKYLIFLDSDDYLELDACEKAFNKIEKEKCDLVVFDFYKELPNNRIEKIDIPTFSSSSLKKNPNLLLDINLGPCNKIYKTSLIKDNGIFFVEDLKYEDAPFVAIAIDEAKKIAKLDEYLSYYVIHDYSETTVRDEKIFDILKIMDIIREYFEEKDYAKEVLAALTVKVITNYTVQQRVQKDKNVGMKFIDNAFTYLESNVPDYKNNKYYEGRGILRRTIEKSKTLTKLYCKIYIGK